ncbi:hypothetical protein ACELLULO517_27070 [Acidisoma cellulosilytica]|uniref:Uncharacterized protein n=1 Tax=Acidisoma cellulosilyticum TaxID=2802395 RepID=A0A964E7F3_9PROT|nr:hypothetical protein [Acidisoma cellulosilyticum]MCB8883938.1 hypothetical protein [Acidisoma cellulosilyticum]
MAQSLKDRWRPGALIDPWLRENAEMLIGLVRNHHWSWTAVAAAMTEAGITYRTGNPWSGQTLRLQIRRAARPLKRSLAAAIATTPIPLSLADVSANKANAPDAKAVPRRVRVPVVKRVLAPAAPLGAEDQTPQDERAHNAREAMRSED